MRLMWRIQEGDADMVIMRQIIDEFPKLVGAEDEFQQFTAAELLQVMSRFFAHSRFLDHGEPEPEPAAAPKQTPVPAETPA